MTKNCLQIWIWIGFLAWSGISHGQSLSNEGPSSKLNYTRWSGNLIVPDPVSIAFDSRGVAFVTQTQRRKIQDLDIRQHQEWIPDDLSLQSIEDKLRFFKKVLRANPDNPSVNAKHVEDHNGDGVHDYRDLAVVSEIIHRVVDTDNDGTADSISVFADDFKTPVTGIAAGVLHHEGHVYATIAPDVWKLSDSNGNGVADTREIFATGFGMHIAYAGHDMHGLTVGPDGKIYWSIGDKGIHASSVNENWKHHYPNQGGVLRCNPDGSEFEVFAHGLRNVQELAFDQYGNLFGFDNDSDQPEERERFLEIVKGLDAGWRCNYQYRGKDYNPWMAERMWEPQNGAQPLHIVPPISNTVNGPCGLAFNPGTALSDDYKNYFFLTSTLGGEQISFRVRPDETPEKSDSFVMKNVHQIGKGIPMIGINFGPDGALYGVDWGGGYPLNKKGAIWKIDVAEKAKSSVREKVSLQLKLNYQTEANEALLELLESPDQRIRLKAQFELARRKKLDLLQKVALTPTRTESARLKRIHAIWGIGQIARSNNDAAASNAIMRTITKPLSISDDPEIRLQIARTVGDVGLSDLGPIIPLLTDANPRVRVQAALAFSDAQTPAAFEAVVEAIKELKPGQTYLRHALAFALKELESVRLHWKVTRESPETVHPERLEALAAHGNESVRMCATIALRKLAFPDQQHSYSKLLAFNMKPLLADRNPTIADEAARAIHDDFSISSAMSDLAASLENPRQKSEAFLRRAINANYRLGNQECLERVANFAANSNNDQSMRVVALNSIETWATPDVLDRVTGRFRQLPTNRNPDSEKAKTQLLTALQSEANQIKLAAIAALRGLNCEIPKSNLVAIYSSGLSPEIRAEALASIFEIPSGLSPEQASRIKAELRGNGSLKAMMRDSLDSDHETLRIAGRQVLSAIDPSSALVEIKNLLSSKGNARTVRERQLGTLLLGRITESESKNLLLERLNLLNRGELELPLILETLEAAQAQASNAELKKALENIEQNRKELAELLLKSGGSRKDIETHFECFSGGNANRGQEIFNNHIDAQCSRCHRVGAKGSTVGPNLKGIASRKPAAMDPTYLLRSIVAPSADIVEKYQTIMLLLDTGETMQGVLVSRNQDETVLADANGKEIRVENEWIEEETTQKVSMMPVATTLTKREIRDLVAYLKTLKSQPKKKTNRAKQNK